MFSQDYRKLYYVYVTLAQHIFVDFWIFYWFFWNILLWVVEPVLFDEFLVKKFFKKSFPAKNNTIFCLFPWFSQNTFPGVCKHLVRDISGSEQAINLKFSGKLCNAVWHGMNWLDFLKTDLLIFNFKKSIFWVSDPLKKNFEKFFNSFRRLFKYQSCKKRINFIAELSVSKSLTQDFWTTLPPDWFYPRLWLFFNFFSIFGNVNSWYTFPENFIKKY